MDVLRRLRKALGGRAFSEKELDILVLVRDRKLFSGMPATEYMVDAATMFGLMNERFVVIEAARNDKGEVMLCDSLFGKMEFGPFRLATGFPPDLLAEIDAHAKKGTLRTVWKTPKHR